MFSLKYFKINTILIGEFLAGSWCLENKHIMFSYSLKLNVKGFLKITQIEYVIFYKIKNKKDKNIMKSLCDK